MWFFPSPQNESHTLIIWCWESSFKNHHFSPTNLNFHVNKIDVCEWTYKVQHFLLISSCCSTLVWKLQIILPWWNFSFIPVSPPCRSFFLNPFRESNRFLIASFTNPNFAKAVISFWLEEEISERMGNIRNLKFMIVS